MLREYGVTILEGHTIGNVRKFKFPFLGFQVRNYQELMLQYSQPYKSGHTYLERI